MNHIFQLSDEQYAKLAAYAAQEKQTPEMLFQSWVNSLTNSKKKVLPRNHTGQTDQKGQEDCDSPLLQVAGMFAIGEPGWADRHDEYLGEGFLDTHADR
jgi:hypothetical protein